MRKKLTSAQNLTLCFNRTRILLPPQGPPPFADSTQNTIYLNKPSDCLAVSACLNLHLLIDFVLIYGMLSILNAGHDIIIKYNSELKLFLIYHNITVA